MSLRSICLFALCLLALSFSVAAQCSLTVNAGPDVYLCTPPSPTQLNGNIGGSYLNFAWTPTTGLQGANTLSPTVNVAQTTTYTLTASAVDLNNNTIVNGDFEQGNIGFTSDYSYSPGNLHPEGVYNITTNPRFNHSGFAFCGDHTSGNGNMMVVNGAGTPGQNVWCQTVSVLPNTEYVFSCWVTSVVASSPALLQFFTNSSALGPVFQAPGQNCLWQNFYSTWNSGSVTSVTICMVNQNTGVGGNDFALDDILFTPVCVQTDQVEVTVINLTAVASANGPIPPCDDPNITLSGDGSSSGANISYEWTTPNGNIVSGETTLNPVVNTSGTYTLYVSHENNGVTCTKTATVQVSESANLLSASIAPPLPFGCGNPSLTLFGHSNDPNVSNYQWMALTGNIVGSSDLQNITINQPGQYELLVTNTTTGCTATATVSVTTNPPIAAATANGPITCTQPTVALSGAGSSTGANIDYVWTASGGGTITSGQNSQNAVAGSAGTYVLAVTNTSSGCTSTATVTIAASNAPPTLSIQPPGSLDCDTQNLTLSATATPANAQLSWTATNGGQLVSGQNTPSPTVNAAGTYTLLVTNQANGCTATASTTVTSLTTPPLAVVQMPANLTCQNPSIALSGSGSSAGANFTYVWSSSPGGTIVAGGNTLQPTVNTAAMYTLLVTNTVTACTATATVNVVSDQNMLVANANAPDTLTCTVGMVMLNSTGSSTGATFSYAWTTTNGNFSGPANVSNPIATSPGSYQLLVTNTANGCTATDLVEIAQNRTAPLLQTSVSAPGLLTCTTPTLTLQGQNGSLPGNFTYQWTAANGGNLVSGLTSLLPTVNAAGQYTLTATNLANGCTGQSTVTVVAQAGTPTAVIATPGPLTCANPVQTLNTAGSSVGANFEYVWTVTNGGNITSGANSPNPAANTAGTYNLLITNTANGCSATTSVMLSGNTTLPSAEAGTPGLLTCSQPLFSLVANQNLPMANLAFQWTTPNGQLVGNPNTAQVNANQAGVYGLLVTDPSNGCQATDSVQVTADQQLPTVTIAPPTPLDCGHATTTLAATATGAMLAYQWQTGGGQFVSGTTSAAPVVSSPGLYSLTVTDGSNGCITTANVIVVENGAPPNVQVAPVEAITCVAPSQIISGQNLSLPGNFSYLWTATNGGNIVSGNNTLLPTVNAGGDYVLTTTNVANGCSSVLSVSITQNTAVPIANAGPDDTLNCISNTLIINGSGTGATTLTYLWAAANGGHFVSGANTFSPTIDQPGLYTLVVTNPASGCTATDLMQVTASQQLPTVAIAPPATLTCSQLTATLSATATGTALSYQWQTNGGQFVSGTTSASPVVGAPGLYSLTVTDGTNGCQRTASVTVLEDKILPEVQIAPVAAFTCTAPTQTIVGQNLSLPGNFSYQWTATNGDNIVSGNSTLLPTVNAGGNYTLTTTNETSGCTSVLQISITQNTAVPIANAGPDDTLNCISNTLIINGLGTGATNLTYLWTAANGGHFASGANTFSPTIDQPGDYTLVVTNPINGCQATDVVHIGNDTDAPQVNTGLPATLTCVVQQTTLQATASLGTNFGYQWTTIGGNFVSSTTTLSPTVDAPGTYQLAVTNTTSGCVSTSTVTVGEDVALPIVDAGPSDSLTCSTTLLSLVGMVTGTNNLIAQWTTSNGHLIDGTSTLAAQVDQPGTYLLTATNPVNGCTATDQVTIGIDTLHWGLNAAAAGSLTCVTLTTGLNAAVTASHGFTAVWTTTDGHFSGPQNMLSAVVDAPGMYQLTIQNTANSCTSTAQVTVMQDIVLPIAKVDLPGQIACDHPSIDLSGTGSSLGTGFNYLWTASNGGQIQSGQTTLAPTVAAAGTYSLLVTNLTNGCQATSMATVTANTVPPTVVISLPQPLTCTHLVTVLDASGSSSGPNFTNIWTTSPGGHIVAGHTTLMPTVDEAGGYLLTIKNTDNGCLGMAQIGPSKNTVLPVADAGPDAMLHCQQTEATLHGSGTAASPLTFAWHTSNGHFQGGGATATPVVDQSGTYTLTVTNTNNGCTATDAAIVTAIPLPTFSPTLWPPDCLDPTGDVDFGPVMGGSGPFRYSTDGGLTFGNLPTFDALALGTHDLVVEDQHGCTTTQTVEVQLPILPTVTLPAGFTLQQGDSVQLRPILNLPPSSIASWEWTPTDGLSCLVCPQPWAKPLRTTSYTLIITDLHGCTALASTQFRVDRKRNVYAPNVFSPNGDGQNDRFLLYGKGVKEVRALRIYDRWGTELFLAEHLQAGDESGGWGGDFRGKALYPAVFVWQAVVEFLDGEVEIFSGDVALVR